MNRQYRRARVAQNQKLVSGTSSTHGAFSPTDPLHLTACHLNALRPREACPCW